MKSRWILFVVAGVATFGCYFDWDDISYEFPCDPLSPNTTCPSSQMRCRPKPDGEPKCEGPVHLPNQDGYCEDDGDCGSLEVCLLPHPLLQARICMMLCRTDSDCREGYTCKHGYDLSVRGESLGACIGGPPAGWECDSGFYAGWVGGLNTKCDCGCGVFDPDCPDDTPERCEACWNGAEALCVPKAWQCKVTQWHDGNCDCGCGAFDKEDCDGPTRRSCDQCPVESCAGVDGCGSGFEVIRPDDNAKCKVLPDGWTCGLETYWDGDICDCGCNTLDPDCDTASNRQCERCPEGSCATPGDCTPAALVATDNSQCLP